MEEPLDESTVIRAGQRPALFLYVPINFFLFEAVVALGLMAAIGFWVVALLPLHIYPVLKTAQDYHWLTTFWINWKYWWYMIPNKGLRGKDTVTFSPAPLERSKYKNGNFQ